MNVSEKKTILRHELRIRIAILLGAILLTFMSFSVRAAEDITTLNGEGTAMTAVFVRSGPDKSYADLGRLNGGDIVTVTGETSSGWYQVVFDGQEGYVYKDYLKVEEGAAGGSVEEPEAEDGTVEEGEPEEGYSITRMKPTWIKMLFAVVAIVVILAIIIFTIFRMRRNDDYEDDYEDDGYDEDDYEDRYDEDEDPYDEEGGYEDEDRYEEGDYEDEDRYEEGDYENGHRRDDYEPVDYYGDDRYDDHRREESVTGQESEDFYNKYEDSVPHGRRHSVRDEEPKNQEKKYVIREEDYRVDIDPKFFEEKDPIEQPAMVTGYLARKMQEEEAEKADVDRKKKDAHEAGSRMSIEKQKELDDAMKKLNELQEEIERLKKQ